MEIERIIRREMRLYTIGKMSFSVDCISINIFIDCIYILKKKTGCNCFVLFNALLLLYSVLFNVLLFSLINMLFLLHFLKNFSFSLKVFVYKLLLFLLFLPGWFLCYSFKLQPKCGWPSGLDAHPLGFDDYFFNLLALPVKCNLFPPLTHY